MLPRRSLILRPGFQEVVLFENFALVQIALIIKQGDYWYVTDK